MIKTGAIGKKYPAVLYEVTRNGIAEYAHTIGIDAPFHFEHEAACGVGFRDIVAPPMYAAVYSAPAIFAMINDPEVGMDVPRNLHASQRFVWSEPVCAGDVIVTKATVAEIFEKNRKAFYIFETISANQRGQETVRGVWTNIVRLEAV